MGLSGTSQQRQIRCFQEKGEVRWEGERKRVGGRREKKWGDAVVGGVEGGGGGQAQSVLIRATVRGGEGDEAPSFWDRPTLLPGLYK